MTTQQTAITFTTLMSGDNGNTLRHLAARNILWHLGGAIARHPVTRGYGLSRQDISEGGEVAFQLDGLPKQAPADLGTLVDGFNYLTATLRELALVEDYDTRTGALIYPFAWYSIPTLESYIRNFQLYSASRQDNARQDQARALGIKTVIAPIDRTTEIDERVAHALTEIRGVSDEGTFEDLESAIAELGIDPLYITHQSAVGMLDRAKKALLGGKSGYIDPEILAFARWTCRPQQGLHQPID